MGAASAWPNRGDSALERARKVARSYRNLAMAADPRACAHLDEHATKVGQDWVIDRTEPIDLDEVVSVPVLARTLDLTHRTLYRWGTEGRITPRAMADGAQGYLMRDVVDLQATMRRRAG